MPVSLPRLVSQLAVRKSTPSPERGGGFIQYHPRYRNWLMRVGISSPTAAWSLPGEIVCGHPDRHVVRVTLGSRVVYLKREHLVGVRTRLRNRLAGFGPVSRGEREAAVLRDLETSGLPGPQWLAYGDDETGRGFLLIDEVAGAVELRTILTESTLAESDRKQIAESIGRTLAELHEAGFGLPELSAKHLLVHPQSFAVTLLDWQSTPKRGPVPEADRVRQLAGLMASLPDSLATASERCRVLWAYRRVVKLTRSATSTQSFAAQVRAIESVAAGRRKRSSIQDQHGVAVGADQRLVWLAGEEVCVVPRLAEQWPTPVNAAPFYTTEMTGEEWLTFADGTRGLLKRYRTWAPIGRAIAAIRERPWRSPAAKQARMLFHLQRFGIPAPRLLAFGQRLDPRACADSFLVSEVDPTVVDLFDRLEELATESAERRVLLVEAGRLLCRLHDTGCRITLPVPGTPVFTATTHAPLEVAVGCTSAVHYIRKVRERERLRDWDRLTRFVLPGLSRTDYARIAQGYAGTGTNTRNLRRAMLRRVIR